MSTSLQVVHAPAGALLPGQSEWAVMLQMAEQMVKSGLLPSHIRSAASAVAIIQAGRELGIPPMYALRKIYMVNGNVTVASEVILALIYQAHGDEAADWIESTSERATLAYKRRGWKEYRQYTYTIQQAQRASLAGKDNWRKDPDAMLRARCVSAVGRMAFPDVIAGMYTPEEMGVEESGAGDDWTTTAMTVINPADEPPRDALQGEPIAPAAEVAPPDPTPAPRPAPKKVTAAPGSNGERPSQEAFNRFWHTVKAQNWQPADVVKVAQDCYGRTVDRLAPAELDLLQQLVLGLADIKREGEERPVIVPLN